MPPYFDRKVMEGLSGPFIEWPIILCPVCHAASLETKDMGYIENYLAQDNAEYLEVAYDPEYAEIDDDSGNAGVDSAPGLTSFTGFFHGVLYCPRTPCRNQYVVTGTWVSVDSDDSAEDDSDDSAEEPITVRQLYVSYVHPSLPLMDFPQGVPDNIRDLVAAASLVLLSDPSACANRIRAAIEALLDFQGIHKYPPNSRKRSSRLQTHARIEEFKKRNAPAGGHLMAMKWIGNAGSHEREPLALSVVLDGIEHFARALELIYNAREKALDRRATQINKKKSHNQSRMAASRSPTRPDR